jgi:hypothetical protein
VYIVLEQWRSKVVTETADGDQFIPDAILLGAYDEFVVS